MRGIFFKPVLRFSAAVLMAVCAGQLFAQSINGQGTWQYTLQPRDLDQDGIVDSYFDTTLKITWLADWNAGAGTQYDDGAVSSTDGKMTPD